MPFSRRFLIRSTLLAAVAPAFGHIVPALAQTPPTGQPTHKWRHGVSLFGDLKYPEGFKHFDYVNPNAPKGGTLRLSAVGGTFDNFNLVIAGVKGSLASGLGLIYEPLVLDAFDEEATAYGLLAEAVSYPDDFSRAAYRLRAEAKWQDGKPVTPEDVIYSFEAFKKYSPRDAAYYRHVVKAEKTGDREVTFTFDGAGNRELPSIVGQLRVLPKHWWEGTDASGKKRDISATTLEPPLSSGTYRIKEFTPGRNIVYERVKDYWGKNVPVRVGTDNFDELRYDYFRDMTVALEAFKGDQIDFRVENSAKNWVTAYDFPAVSDKRVLLEEFQIRSEGRMQGFVFNLRRDKFRDPRLRRAFNLAYDFEEMNKQLSSGLNKRIGSYFEGTELACSGLPTGLELEILETVRDKVPPEVFTTPYANPVNGNPEAVRNNLREAVRLLKEAGYEIKNQRLVDGKTGAPFSFELLLDDQVYERFVVFYRPALQKLGIEMTTRIVDSTQYQNRLRNWDYDMIVAVWGESLSPGNEQREFWGSQSADNPGSMNYVGIKNPAVDTLIDRVIFAKNRDELVAATHALDRVLLWNHYVVPQFTYDKERTARWDRFGRPDQLPKFGASTFPTVWWWDEARAAKTGSRR